MKRPFYRCVVLVTGVHVFAIMVLVVFSAIPSRFQQKEETFVAVEFMVDTSQLELETPAELIQKSAPPEPDEPVVEVPTPQEKKKERPKVEVNHNKIRRSDASKVNENRFTEDEILKLLNQGAIAGDRNTAAPDADQRFIAIIKGVMDQAWAQPGREAVGDSKTTVRIRFDSRGRIIERAIVSRSGNDMMDASVLEALNHVQKIDGLSPDFISRRNPVTIAFQVEE